MVDKLRSFRLTKRSKLFLLSAVVITPIFAVVISTTIANQSASADYLCITARCKDAAAKEATAVQQAKDAEAQKGTYQGEVNRLSAEIAGIQAQIDAGEAAIANLTELINANDAKIATLKKALIKTMVKSHLDANTSALEILADAQDLNDYTEKLNARDSVKSRIEKISDELVKTKSEQESQRTTLERTKADNIAAKEETARKQAEQQALVTQWAGREAEYANSASKAREIKEAEMEAVRQELARQAAAKGGGSVLPGDPNKGGYPYAGECPWNGDAHETGTPTGWGYVCECVSYAGWKVYEKTGYSPKWWGNANMWPGSARNAGFTVGREPRANSIAVWTYGTYGHVAYVEWVNGGTMAISQYNWVPFQYDMRTVNTSMFEYYIYL